MLVSMHIENIAVIEKADVEFDNGFTVLTGETGAGKSIIIDSINAVLGRRTSKELIRTGCDKAFVTATFSDVSNQVVEKLSSLGFQVENNELIITRTITESKSSAKINGQNATAFVLKEIAPLLIDIHGQNDSQALLNPEKHYIYIDLMAENQAILDEYKTAFSQMLKTRKFVKQAQQNEEDRIKQIELLNFQIKELEDADIKLGEKQELIERRNVIANSQKIADALENSLKLINGEDDLEVKGAFELLGDAANELLSVSNYSKDISSTCDKLSDVKYKLDDVKDEISTLLNANGFDENELEQIEQRLDMYYNFSLKYGEDEAQMIKFLEEAKEQLSFLENSQELSKEYQNILPSQIKAVKELGEKLTQTRKKAGEEFSREVAKQLEFLDMPSVKISVNIEKVAYSSLGSDKIEFLISTNPGEPLKPLSKIASGGEMSRIMLGIKNVLSSNDVVSTLIFDEIDTGISGSAATKVGKKLKETAKGKQVICVTHLAQIAAMADEHLLILKNIVNNRAVTDVTKLDFDGRKNEIARIIGSKVTDVNLASAEEMLKGDML